MSTKKKRRAPQWKIPAEVYKKAIEFLFNGNDFGAAWAAAQGRGFYDMPDSGGEKPVNTKLGRILREATTRAMEQAELFCREKKRK